MFKKNILILGLVLGHTSSSFGMNLYQRFSTMFTMNTILSFNRFNFFKKQNQMPVTVIGKEFECKETSGKQPTNSLNSSWVIVPTTSESYAAKVDAINKRSEQQDKREQAQDLMNHNFFIAQRYNPKLNYELFKENYIKHHTKKYDIEDVD